MDHDSFSPPPYSEQEFDQKVSLVTDLSSQSPPVDEDGWEVYDPTSFENISSVSAKAASADNSHPPAIPPYNGTCSSSGNRIPFEKQPTHYWRKDKPDPHDLPSTTPLRIEKKSQPIATQYGISNLSDVGATYGVDIHPPQSSYPPEDPSNFSSSSQAKHFADNFGEYQTQASSSRVQSGVYYEQIVTELEGEFAAEPHSPAPPSFEEDDPSLSDIDSERIETPNQVPFVDDPRHRVSRPPSDSSALALQALYSHEPDHSRYSLVDPYYHAAQPTALHRSLPVQQPLPQGPIGARPVSTYQSPPVPFMTFNPSVAYGKVMTPPVLVKPPAPPQANPQYDPHSFYNSAVSAKLTSLRPLQGNSSQPFPNDVWQSQGQFPQQSSQMGTAAHPVSTRFSQVADSTRQSNIWHSDRQVSSYTTYSPSNRSSVNDSNQFPRYPIPPNQNSIYYGNGSFTEQGGYNVR